MWPWISRRAHEEILRRERERFDALLEKHLAFLGSFHPPVAAVAPPASVRVLEPLKPREQTDLDVAIELQAMSDPALARHLQRYATEQKLKGKGDIDIINEILHWQSSDDEDFAGVS